MKWDSLNYTPNSPFASEANFGSFLDAILIPRAQKRINSYCRRDFDVDYPSGIPEDVKDVCARVVANMIQILVINRAGPLIKTADYRIQIADQAVMTDDIKVDLAPYMKATDPVFYEQSTE